MDSDIMHYIPAVNEAVALGLVNGATIAGVNSVLLLDSHNIDKLNIKFNVDSSIPLFIISAYNEATYNFNNDSFYTYKLSEDVKNSICDLVSNGLSNNKQCIMFIGEGVLI